MTVLFLVQKRVSFLLKMKILNLLFLISGLVKATSGRCPTFGALPQFGKEGLRNERVSTKAITETENV